MFMIILRVFHNSLLFGFEETKGLYSLTCIRSEYNTNSSVVYNRIINDCLEVMCVRYKTECIQLNYCEYQVLSPRSYGLIVTIILQVHPGSSGALWGCPLCWPPSVRLRVIRLSLGRRSANLLPVAQRTINNALRNGVIDRPSVVGREFESHVHYEKAF